MTVSRNTDKIESYWFQQIPISLASTANVEVW